jgi:hypothetical protein
MLCEVFRMTLACWDMFYYSRRYHFYSHDHVFEPAYAILFLSNGGIPGVIVGDDIVYPQPLHISGLLFHQFFQVVPADLSYVNPGIGKDIFRPFAFKRFFRVNNIDPFIYKKLGKLDTLALFE